MTPASLDHAALALRFTRRWGSFSAPDESYALALESIWKAQRTWRESAGCAFHTWAAWYARTRLMRLRMCEARRRSRVADGDVDEMCVASTEPDVDRVAEVRAAINRLPGKQRRAIELLFLEGLTQTEAAAEFGTTRQAVAKLTQRGLKSLKRALKPADEAPF